MTSKPITPTKVDRIGHLYATYTRRHPKSSAHTAGAFGRKHDSCPFSTNSWCYFQKALALVAEDASIAPPNLRQSYLNTDELSRLRDVFKKFASIEMCSASTLGMTQNSNESLHSVLWHNAPKGKRIVQKSLQASAALSVSTFNEGSMMLAAVLADLGFQSSRKTLTHFVVMDRERNRFRIKAVTATQKRRRRLLKSRFVATERSRKKRETDTAYRSGAFGSEITPDSANPAIVKSDSDTVWRSVIYGSVQLGEKGRLDSCVL